MCDITQTSFVHVSIYIYLNTSDVLGIYSIKLKWIIMLSLEEISDRLTDRNLARVAEKTGLTYMTVWKVKVKRRDNFSYTTIEKLNQYFEEWP